MKRVAFKMKLDPGQAAEYKRRHDEIWPELEKELTAAGIFDYAIFLDEETNILFGIQKVKALNHADELPGTDVVKRWWKYMADIMETNPDNSPVQVPLKEVFYME
jgi:L-rhamnose mutarotase